MSGNLRYLPNLYVTLIAILCHMKTLQMSSSVLLSVTDYVTIVTCSTTAGKTLVPTRM